MYTAEYIQHYYSNNSIEFPFPKSTLGSSSTHAHAASCPSRPPNTPQHFHKTSGSRLIPLRAAVATGDNGDLTTSSTQTIPAGCSNWGVLSPSAASAAVWETGRGSMVLHGLTPLGAVLAALGVVVPVLLAWLAQPLLSTRAFDKQAWESEDVFWRVGPDGCVPFKYASLPVMSIRLRYVCATKVLSCTYYADIML